MKYLYMLLGIIIFIFGLFLAYKGIMIYPPVELKVIEYKVERLEDRANKESCYLNTENDYKFLSTTCKNIVEKIIELKMREDELDVEF